MASVISSSDADLSSLVDTEEINIGTLTDQELYNLVLESRKSHDILKIETKVFELFLKRVDPKELDSQQTLGVNYSEQSQRVFRKRAHPQNRLHDRHFKLTSQQKCDIATKEIEELKNQMKISKESYMKKIENFNAVMQEADIRLTEVKKNHHEFNRDIVNGAINPRNKKVIAEKFTRWIDDKMKASDGLIEKMRLKNSTLKVQKNKLQQQLKQKEEMGEVLHEVDFNQLKIENLQYLGKIEERNQELLSLKLTATNISQSLNAHKEKLSMAIAESARLKAEIIQRRELLSRIENEAKVVELEKNEIDMINKKYRENLSDYKVPEVLEYVQEKAELYDLKKLICIWERKVEIAKMALRSHEVTWDRSVHLNNAQENLKRHCVKKFNSLIYIYQSL
ncbi:cilia- and flagella-associated protein 263 isoform X2 [Hydra vulgaris]|uniref:Cilia- and flagella-associated protein 263 n=1 Tax=Hydra vulgaris TaxID=6087 RepID=A0ABM4DJR4_HYDVU